jgi:hypothetical protein
MPPPDAAKPAPPAPAPAAPPVKACPACPDVVIEINETPDAKDDLVLLKCEHPAHRSKTKCRIKAVACAGGADVTMVLTNPDGRLRFPNSGDSTKTVSLPADGSWVHFEISGETASAALNDAVIEAHCATAAGAVKGTGKVTVVSFDPATLDITPGGTYTLGGGRYTVVGAHAVDYKAKATIKPAGVDCAAPQIKDLRIGLMQNAKATVKLTITWSNPTMAWTPSVAKGTDIIAPAGTVVNVPTTIRRTSALTAQRSDTDAPANPLYDRPAVATTLDAGSLAKPVGCAGGGTATSFDTPGTPAPATLTQKAKKGATEIGTVTYTLLNVNVDTDFITWTVLIDPNTNEFCALRERTWSVHADSSAAAQKATAGAADTAPTMDPVTGPPFGNDEINSAAATKLGPVGAATTPFTVPKPPPAPP